MKKYFFAFLVASFITGCSSESNLIQPELLNGQDQVNALANKTLTLDLEGKKDSESKFTLNKEKVSTKINLNKPMKDKINKPVKITYDAPVAKNSTRDDLAIIRMAFNSMNQMSDYRSSWNVARKAVADLHERLKLQNDPDTGMRELMQIMRSIEGEMYHETWSKVYARGLQHFLTFGSNENGRSIDPQSLAKIVLRLMDEGKTWQESCYIGKAGLVLYRSNYPQVKPLVNMALSAPDGRLSWEDWNRIIKNTLNEISVTPGLSSELDKIKG